MLDPQQLLDQLLGAKTGDNLRSAGRQVKDRLDQAGGANAFAGGAIAGGLLGMLLGGGRARRRGGTFGYGSAAVLGALAMRAYQSYEQQRATRAPRTAAPGSVAPQQAAASTLPHTLPAADGSPFELVLVRAMIGAAKADGHIDAAEQRRLFAEVERIGLDADAKAYVFDLLTRDIDIESLASAVTSEAQAAELFLAARLGIDVDEPAERAYLDALASRLDLPDELRAQLEDAATGK
jgi:uncharacterized membrane protein YebE (DUF533 family)